MNHHLHAVEIQRGYEMALGLTLVNPEIRRGFQTSIGLTFVNIFLFICSTVTGIIVYSDYKRATILGYNFGYTGFWIQFGIHLLKFGISIALLLLHKRFRHFLWKKSTYLIGTAVFLALLVFVFSIISLIFRTDCTCSITNIWSNTVVLSGKFNFTSVRENPCLQTEQFMPTNPDCPCSQSHLQSVDMGNVYKPMGCIYNGPIGLGTILIPLVSLLQLILFSISASLIWKHCKSAILEKLPENRNNVINVASSNNFTGASAPSFDEETPPPYSVVKTLKS